jgi:PAS domain S-box-containing protein
MLTLLTVVLLLLAGILLHNALIHLVSIGNRRMDPVLRWYGFLCLIASSYALACVFKYHAPSPEEYISAARWTAVSARLLMVFIPWFIGYYADHRTTRLPRLISAIFLLMAALDLLLPTRWLYPEGGTLSHHTTPWGEKIAAWSGDNSLFVYLLYAGYLGVIIHAGLAIQNLFRLGDPGRAWPLAGVAAFGVASFINDALLDADAIRSFYLEEFAIFAFLMMLGTWLGSRRVRAERNYQTLFNAVSDGIFVHDRATGRLFDVNEAGARMFHTTREEILKNGFSHVLTDGPPYSPQDAAEHVQRVQPGIPDLSEWRTHNRKDGSEIWVETALRWEVLDGRDAILAVVRDVTSRKKAEERLRDTQKLESLGVLAGGVAHDFNNLLTTILGNAELACHDLPANSAARASLDNIRTASHRAADLCRQLLAYSGKGRFSVGTVDFRELAVDMVRLLKISMPPGVALEASFSPFLLPVTADATQVRQVVMNLVVNAADAMKGRQGSVRVFAGSERLDEKVLAGLWSSPEAAPGTFSFLEVADDGCGMDESTRSRVFEPFFSTKFAGRGLGMAAVLGIVRGHRGAIRIDTEKDRGTTVRTYFPAEPLPAVATAPAPPGAARRQVLAVDDDPAVRDSLCKALEAVGYDALPAEDGPRAVALLKEHGSNIAAVLLDMRMPGWDGERTLRELKAIDPAVRVVLVSGAGQDSLATGSGFSGFLPKPYRFQDLKAVLDRVTGTI